MCVRVVNLKGVDLSRYTFDWDLTWYAFFMTPMETELMRFGGRDDKTSTGFLSLDALKTAMDRALVEFKAWTPPKGPPPHLNDTPEKRGIKPDKQGCVHCHMITTDDWKARQAKNKWDRDEIWQYPVAANLGLEVDPKTGTTVTAAAKGSPAKVGDDILKIDGRRVRSFGDLSYVLNGVSKKEIDIVVLRDGKEETLKLKLPTGWRKTDLSWRESTWQIPPNSGIWYEELGDGERDKLKVARDAMAIRVKQIFDANSAAPKAGLQQGDVIVGVNGDKTRMDPRRFNVLLRVDLGPGKKVTLKVLRGGQAKDIVFTQ